MAAAGAAAAVIGVAAGPAAASTPAARAPNITIWGPPISSSIVSGYAAEASGPGQSFTLVQDAFVIPKVTCDGPGIAQFGVGLGGNPIGDQSSTQQVMVSATCKPHNLTPTYAAGYEQGSASMVTEFIPSAGDAVALRVSASGIHYKMSMQDNTNKDSFGIIVKCSTCQNSSAQVTAGSPAGSTPADFGKVHFTQIQVIGSPGGAGGLVNAAWNTAKLIQLGSPHTVAEPLQSLGPPPHSAFWDKWK